MTKHLHKQISDELSLQEYQVTNTIDLMFVDECTIPFVARYRKERTGALDEVKIRDIRDRFQYLQELEFSKIKYLKVVKDHCSSRPELNFKELALKFSQCKTKQELEDLYLPFKPKRRTRAQVAKEKGLEPLALKLFSERASIENLEEVAKSFIHAADEKIDPALKVNSVEDALEGAADILAEKFAETADHRALVRDISSKTGLLVSKPIASPLVITDKTESSTIDKKRKKILDKQEKKIAKYKNYFSYRESINTAPAHRIMAVRRGEAEKVLKLTLEVDTDKILRELKSSILSQAPCTDKARKWIETVIEDSYKRLVSPSIETEIRLTIKTRAENEAIRVFAHNLESLLLIPPMPQRIVMGVDPGIRTGSKLAVVDDTGKLLAHTTIYPKFDKKDDPKNEEAKKTIAKLIKDHEVKYLAVGNGTGGREINRIIRTSLKENDIKDVKRLFVNEAGASVYSTDQVAREEFPDLDPTIRSAISIARRLQDPLAELVKIEPRSIGVGQYQHDVNVTKLKNSLEEVVESCVNRVGVSLNSASSSLLSYVSGVGPTMAKNIVKYRDKHGPFNSRSDVQKVIGLGPKAYQQAAGFLRVSGSESPLDNSAVHPERYEIVEQLTKDLKMSISDLIGKKELIEAIPFEKYVTAQVGMPTLRDIANELIKPGRDPRDETKHVEFSDDINEITDLKKDMKMQGTVTNVTNFGAFVDIGVHQDGLIHISELSNEFIKDPTMIVSVGEVVNVRVIDVDIERKRISLSSKLAPTPNQKPIKSPVPRKNEGPRGNRPHHQTHGNRPQGKHPRGGKPHQRKGPPKERKPQFTMDDLLNKFNKKV